MKIEQIQEYYRHYNSFQAGLMTEDQWQTYCTEFLYNLMEENKEVFERLKDR